MAGHGNKISRKFEQAIAALLSEKTVDLAAAKAGVTARTLITWQKREDFQQQYRQARHAILERCVARLLRLTDKAVDTLESNLACDKAEAANRAAIALLEHAFKGMEDLDMAAEIKAVKQELAEVRHGLSESASSTDEDQSRAGVDTVWPPEPPAPELNGAAGTSTGTSASEGDHASP